MWLDELQRFLDGPYLTPGSTPITATAVRHLLDAPTPVVVLGAMWSEHASQLRATEPDPHTPGQRPRYPGAADILNDKGRVRQETLTSFSGTEHEAAVKLSSYDPRLKKAVADRDYNVTEVLAGAPQLVARYEQASDDQQAVLNAAIDARRLGILAPLTEGLLRAAARGYLSTLHPDDTWLPAALTELTRHDRPQDHATAPLIQVFNEEKSEILGYTVADYLQQRLTRQRRSTRLSAVTWRALIDHTHDDDLFRLAVLADRRLLYRYAEPLYRHFVDSVGSTYAAYRLADLLVERNGPDKEVIAAFQILIADGQSYTTYRWIVSRLAKRGRDDTAAAVLRAWADADDKAAEEDWADIVESWFKRLLAQDKIDQAMTVLRAFTAADGIRKARSSRSLDDWLAGNCRTRTDWYPSFFSGDPSGGREYVVEGWFDRLAQQGRADDAVTILRAVADAGGIESAQTLAVLRAEQGDLDELRARADDEIQRARRARPGEWVGDWFRTRLADTLAGRGDLDELRARADDDDSCAASRLAGLLAGRGDLDGLRALAEAGSGYAASRLAGLLADRGDLDGAAQILRGPADAGDPWWAPAERADLLAKRGDLHGLRALADAGDKAAASRLAGLLADRGDLDGAAQILRALADAGNEYAAGRWAELLIEQDRTDEAPRIVRALAECHSESSASQWCRRLAEQGRTDEELTVLRALTDTGDRWAADRLAGKLIALNRIEEALDVLRAWDVAGDSWVAARLVDNVDRLIALNRIEEALDVLRAHADADGSNEVRSRLAELLVQQNNLDELRARADNGDGYAGEHLARLLGERGDVDELRARADAGDFYATWQLAERGDLNRVTQILRARADNGDDEAAFRLADLLARQGCTDELRERADAGDRRAAQELTSFLCKQGDVKELRDEVYAGTDSAGAALVDLLSATGEGEHAERIRSFGLNPDGSTADGDPASHRT